MAERYSWADGATGAAMNYAHDPTDKLVWAELIVGCQAKPDSDLAMRMYGQINAVGEKGRESAAQA